MELTGGAIRGNSWEVTRKIAQKNGCPKFVHLNFIPQADYFERFQ